MENNVQSLLGVSMEKIKEMVDVNTVVGDPITTPNGIMLIPVSKISYGFAGGGSDLPTKSNAALFGGWYRRGYPRYTDRVHYDRGQ